MLGLRIPAAVGCQQVALRSGGDVDSMHDGVLLGQLLIPTCTSRRCGLTGCSMQVRAPTCAPSEEAALSARHCGCKGGWGSPSCGVPRLMLSMCVWVSGGLVGLNTQQQCDCGGCVCTGDVHTSNIDATYLITISGLAETELLVSRFGRDQQHNNQAKRQVAPNTPQVVSASHLSSHGCSCCAQQAGGHHG